jgi:hypothetical protein
MTTLKLVRWFNEFTTSMPQTQPQLVLLQSYLTNYKENGSTDGNRSGQNHDMMLLFALKGVKVSRSLSARSTVCRGALSVKNSGQ